MSYIIIQDSSNQKHEKQFRPLKAVPLKRFAAWCTEKTVGTILGGPIHSLFYGSIFLRLAAVIAASLITGALVNIAISSFPLVPTTRLLWVCAILGAIASFGGHGAGGVILGSLLGWIVGVIAEAISSELISDWTSPSLIYPLAWIVAVTGGWLIGSGATWCFDNLIAERHGLLLRFSVKLLILIVFIPFIVLLYTFGKWIITTSYISISDLILVVSMWFLAVIYTLYTLFTFSYAKMGGGIKWPESAYQVVEYVPGNFKTIIANSIGSFLFIISSIYVTNLIFNLFDFAIFYWSILAIIIVISIVLMFFILKDLKFKGDISKKIKKKDLAYKHLDERFRELGVDSSMINSLMLGFRMLDIFLPDLTCPDIIIKSLEPNKKDAYQQTQKYYSVCKKIDATSQRFLKKPDDQKEQQELSDLMQELSLTLGLNFNIREKMLKILEQDRFPY